MIPCKVLLLSLALIIFPANIHSSNGEIILDKTSSDVLSTVKKLKLNLENAINDIITTTIDFEDRLITGDITKFLQLLNSKFQPLLIPDQFETVAKITKLILDASHTIDAIRNVVSNVLRLLKEISHELKKINTNLDFLFVASEKSLAEIYTDLRSTLSESLIQLKSYSNIVFVGLTNIIALESIRFKDTINEIEQIISIKSANKLMQMTRDEIEHHIDILMHLFNIQQLFDKFTNSIHYELSHLMSTVEDTSTGIVAPLVSTLTNTLRRRSTCDDCSSDDGNFIAYSKQRKLNN